MKLIFQANVVIDGKLYRKDKELQEVPDKALENWFVKNCIFNGDIVVPAGTKMEPIRGLCKPPKAREVVKQ